MLHSDVDPATGLFEIASVRSTRADHVANVLEQTWLTRYPWPEQVVLDKGSEFMGEVREMLQDYGIKRRPITTRNPQANAMVERAHQTVHNLVRTMQLQDRSQSDEHEPFAGDLSACRMAMRATVHTTTRATPMQLVFNRDS